MSHRYLINVLQAFYRCLTGVSQVPSMCLTYVIPVSYSYLTGVAQTFNAKCYHVENDLQRSFLNTNILNKFDKIMKINTDLCLLCTVITSGLCGCESCCKLFCFLHVTHCFMPHNCVMSHTVSCHTIV